MDLAYDDIRYTVYRWGFSCLGYLFDVLISWIRKLGLHCWFSCICFHQVLLWIFAFVVIIIILYMLIYSYHIIPCMLPSWYHLLSLYHFCMSVLMTRFSIHALLIQIYRYTCAYLCMPLGIRHTTRWAILTPLNPQVQISEFGACGFSQLLIRDAQLKRGSSADRLKPYPFMPPAQLSSFPFGLVSIFCTIHYCISLCILAFAPISEVIFL